MPTLPLTTHYPSAPLRATGPGGTRLDVPLPQFRCLAGLPNTFLPRDAIIDTGSPLTWMPEGVWTHFREGTDYEVLPWAPGFAPPPGRTAGWNFTFRLARLLQPVRLYSFHSSAELVRDRVVVQLASGNPPVRGQSPPRIVIGLWGGLLDGTAIRISPGAAGLLAGALEW